MERIDMNARGVNQERHAPHALIADDQPDVLAALHLLLKSEGYKTQAVTSPEGILKALGERSFDVLLMDLNYARDTTSGQEGLDLLARIRSIDETLPVVAMTAWGSVDLAVEAMRRGVGDFIQKPWDNARLLNILRTQIEQGARLRKRRRLETARRTLSDFLLAAEDLNTMLSGVALQLHGTLGARSVLVLNKTPGESVFHVRASAGTPDERQLVGPWYVAPDGVTFFTADHGGAGQPEEDSRAGSRLPALVRIGNELIFLLHREAAAGRFDSDESDFLSAVGNQIGSGIDRLRWRGHDHEFEEAREIQQRLLPKDIPQIKGYEIAGAWLPAKEVGGDYFDVLRISDREVGLCIADVVGKGVPAALLMSNVQAAVKAFAFEDRAPRELCQKVNRIIFSNIAPNKFITLCYCLLDAQGKRLLYATAGHNAPILVRRNGSHERLEKGGAVLGVFPEWGYEQGEVPLESGDRILLFTDGVTEVTNQEGEEFGEERLLLLLTEHLHLPAGALKETVMAAVCEFGSGVFQDDATLVVLSVD